MDIVYRTIVDAIQIDGVTCLIDSEDRELVAGFSWRALELPHTTYIVVTRRNLTIYMHRLVFGAGPDEQVDHINCIGWDNRKNNLRSATSRQQAANKRKRIGTSQFKGVSWDAQRGRWFASIRIDGKQRALGRFDDEREAAQAYDAAARGAWGEFARLNFEELLT